MSRPGFSFLVCPDPELIKQRLDRLVAEAEGTYERKVFWGDEGLSPAFWEGLTLQNLMGGAFMLVVRRAEQLPKEDWDALGPALARFNPQAWPVFCLEAAFERGKPKLGVLSRTLYKRKYWIFGQDKGWVWQSPGLDAKGLAAFVSDWAKRHGHPCQPAEAQRLAALLPADATAAARELEKLALAPGGPMDGGPLTAGVDALAGQEPELDIFAFLRALQDGRKAEEVWRQVLDSPDMVFPFLGMLQREARILWQLAVGDAAEVRLPPAVRAGKEQLARSMGLARLGRLWDAALAAEWGVKSGERKPDQAMQALAAALFALFADKGLGARGKRG